MRERYPKLLRTIYVRWSSINTEIIRGAKEYKSKGEKVSFELENLDIEVVERIPTEVRSFLTNCIFVLVAIPALNALIEA